MGRVVAGSFTAAGQQSNVFGASRAFNLSLDVGSGDTVVLQRHMGGEWRDVSSYTADVDDIVEIAGTGIVEYRLDSRVYSAGSEYLMAYDEDLLSSAAQQPSASYFARLTEAGDERITEEGDVRVTEDAS